MSNEAGKTLHDIDLDKELKGLKNGKPDIIGNDIDFDLRTLNNSEFKKLIEYFDSRSTAPTEFIMTALISVLSGVIGRTAYFRITERLNIFLPVWSLIIGRSTVFRKSTTLKDVTYDCYRLENDLFELFKIKKANWETGGKKGNEPKRETLLFPNDVTVEALIEILGASKRGVLVFDEFTSLLEQIKRSYSAGALEFLMQTYDCPPLYTASRKTTGDTILKHPFLSMAGATTLENFRSKLQDVHLTSGFLPRFIFAYRNQNKKQQIPLLQLGDISLNNASYYDTGGLFKRLFELSDKYPDGLVLGWTDQAKKLHMDYDNKIRREIEYYDTDILSSFMGRLVINAVKFAGIIALTNGRTEVNESDIKDAIALCFYYKSMIELLLREKLMQTPAELKEEQFISLIMRAGGKITRSELMRYSRLNKKEFDETISTMLGKEKIVSKKEPVKGSKKYSEFYYLNG